MSLRSQCIRWSIAYVNSNDAALALNGKKLVELSRTCSNNIIDSVDAIDSINSINTVNGINAVNDIINASKAIIKAQRGTSFTVTYDVQMMTVSVCASITTSITENYKISDDVILPCNFSDKTVSLNDKYFIHDSILYRIFLSENMLTRKRKHKSEINNCVNVWCLPLRSTLEITNLELDLEVSTDSDIKLSPMLRQLEWESDENFCLVNDIERSVYYRSSQYIFINSMKLLEGASSELVDIFDRVCKAIRKGTFSNIKNRIISALNYPSLYKLTILRELVINLGIFINCNLLETNHVKFLTAFATSIDSIVNHIN